MCHTRQPTIIYLRITSTIRTTYSISIKPLKALTTGRGRKNNETMNFPRISSLRKLDLMSIRCSTYATLLMFASAIMLAAAFVSPYWLESEAVPNQRFQRLGLWEACFNRLHDHHYRYDRMVSGCKWIFDEDYRFLMDYLEPGKS